MKNEINNLFSLKGKTALITGASSGLGARFAHILSAAGARVILTARRIDKLEEISSKLPNASCISMDVSDKISIANAFADFKDEKIDICINNAGISRLTPIFSKENNDFFEEIFQTNVIGAWYVTKAAANHMKKYNINGSIINISSVRGANSLRIDHTAYATSKAAITHMTKALVGELSPHNIRINAISPGLIHTPLTTKRFETEENTQKWQKSIPLDFIAEPPNLDAAILYLASNKASAYVTGSTITIDGGISWGGGSGQSHLLR
jgi:NAD(P)-dependent dehydrogenase (short-subunit alcohol dehydrogenase family)